MRILVIGGTRFMGPRVVDLLVESGHSVTVFHRGNSKLKQHVQQILGDRNELSQHQQALQGVQADVVLDMIPHQRHHAQSLLQTLAGHAGRLVAISSANIYHGFAVFTGDAPPPVTTQPLREDSPIREQPVPGDDKASVEQVLLHQDLLPATALRLPMVYGPGDFQHRLHDILRRIVDGRRINLLEQGLAAARLPRGYVDNVAHAIFLAVTDNAAAGIYNVAEDEPPSELEWTQQVGAACGWEGEVRALPMERCPDHLQHGLQTAQCIAVDSTRIRAELDYVEPVLRDEAIRRTVAWELANPPEPALPPIDYAAEDHCLAHDAGGTGAPH
jgi:nucleoside-diphosphate-sugar epimerase